MTPQLGEFMVRGPHGFSRVAYAEWGPQQASRAVICAHGLTRNGRDFDILAEALAARGCRVVAPDLPGRGRSQWLRDPEHYDLPLYAAVMGALIARIGAHEVDWIGTSLGGFIGMQLAAEAGSSIRRLVLNDFGARVPAMALRRIGNYVGISPRFEHIGEVEAHLREIHAPFGRLTGEHSDLLLRNTVREMAHRRGSATRHPVRIVEFPDCGHAPALMNQEQISPILEFLLADDASCMERQGLESAL